MSSNNTNDNSIDFQNFINNNRLTNEYQTTTGKLLGFGTYGVVIKARNKIDEKDYAVKMIGIVSLGKSMNEDFKDKINELKIWAKLLDMEFCVQYRSAWLENDDTSKKRFLDLFSKCLPFCEAFKSPEWAVLNIQMDLCSLSLYEGLENMKEHFKYRVNPVVHNLAYYISSEILYELLEAVNYLHTQPEPVIHRDIKPANVLIKFTPNGRCVKLGDFGLAVLHVSASQTHTQGKGTDQYMAPEVRRSRTYSPKADVYSIGIITQELFNFDVNRTKSDDYPQKYKKMIEKTALALSGLSRNRLTCKEFMELRSEWALDYSTVQEEIVNTVDKNIKYDDQAQFVYKFLQMKRLQNEY